MDVSLTMYKDSAVLFADRGERPPNEMKIEPKITNLGKMEADITILLEGLLHINYPLNLTIRTKSKYIYGSLKWLDQWADRGWVNSKGKPIRYIDLWQQVYKEIKKHRYTVEFY